MQRQAIFVTLGKNKKCALPVNKKILLKKRVGHFNTLTKN